MKTTLKLGTLAASTLLLAGCASVNFDAVLSDANDSTQTFTQGTLQLQQTQAQQLARDQLAADLLSKPLGIDDAVQLALANSPAVQALLAQSWAEMASANQSGRIGNPLLSLERSRLGSELELSRMLSFGLLDLLTLPQRQRIAQGQIAQAKVQLAASVVEQVTQVRQAWVRAVAAQQSLNYARQISATAQAGAELARRMQQVGNFTKLQRARQQSFYADAAAQMATAQHSATAAREELIRQLGLTEAQTTQLTLAERLPDLPKAPRPAAGVNANAMEQRLDVALARRQLDVAGRSQGLNLLTSLVDVELSVRRDTVTDEAAGTQAARQGYGVGIRLPIFDWGSAQRDGMNAQSLASAQRYESTVRSATSQLRESYSAYRTAYDIAKHYRDEIVPLHQSISEENLLRYNGMLIGVFELLADAREQITSVNGAINAYQQFWLADAALAAAVLGKTTSLSTPSPSSSASAEAGH